MKKVPFYPTFAETLVKKISTIFLLLLIIQYTFGLFTVYIWNSLAIKQSMKAAIAAGSFRHNQITIFTVSLSQITKDQADRWQQDEISINGKMYDVISARQVNGQLTLKCICDEDENLLVTSYKQATDNGHNSSPDKSMAVLKNAFLYFIITQPVISFLQIGKGTGTSLLQYQSAFATMQCIGVLTPPPRQA